MIATILNLITVALFVAIAAIFTRAYLTTTGSIWQRTLAAGKNSAVIAWQYLLIAANGLCDLILKVVGLFADPSTVSQVQAYIPPEGMRWFMVFCAVMTIAARLRPKSSEPVG